MTVQYEHIKYTTFVFYSLLILPEKFNTFEFHTVVHFLVARVYFYLFTNWFSHFTMIFFSIWNSSLLSPFKNQKRLITNTTSVEIKYSHIRSSRRWNFGHKMFFSLWFFHSRNFCQFLLFYLPNWYSLLSFLSVKI